MELLSAGLLFSNILQTFVAELVFYFLRYVRVIAIGIYLVEFSLGVGIFILLNPRHFTCEDGNAYTYANPRWTNKNVQLLKVWNYLDILEVVT